MIDQIISAQSIDSLKKLGSYRDVRKLLQEKLTGRLQIKARGWKDLYEILEILRGIDTQIQQDIPYFKSEADQLIYALVELSGEPQLKALGLNRAHFRDAKKAKQLRNSIAHQIHPDKCTHPRAQDAMNKLTKLFNEVID
jgi:hypothetical protein